MSRHGRRFIYKPLIQGQRFLAVAAPPVTTQYLVSPTPSRTRFSGKEIHNRLRLEYQQQQPPVAKSLIVQTRRPTQAVFQGNVITNRLIQYLAAPIGKSYLVAPNNPNQRVFPGNVILAGRIQYSPAVPPVTTKYLVLRKDQSPRPFPGNTITNRLRQEYLNIFPPVVTQYLVQSPRPTQYNPLGDWLSQRVRFAVAAQPPVGKQYFKFVRNPFAPGYVFRPNINVPPIIGPLVPIVTNPHTAIISIEPANSAVITIEPANSAKISITVPLP